MANQERELQARRDHFAAARDPRSIIVVPTEIKVGALRQQNDAVRLRKNARGFTLLELLIVIALLAILAVVVLIVLNPGETLKRARDAQRMSDLSTMKTAIATYLTDVKNPDLDGTGAGFPNCNAAPTNPCSFFYGGDGNSATQNIVGFGPITQGADCTGTTDISISHQDDSTVTGGGWMLIDFTQVFGGSPLASLPFDPKFSVADLGNVR